MRELGRVGVWSAQLRSRDPGRIRDIATTIEELGYDAARVPGGAGGDLLGHVDVALDTTARITVASGILNIWAHEAGEVAAWHAGVRSCHSGRMLLGLGASHAGFAAGYRRPLTAMRTYLDALDAAPDPVPADERLLAALGPRILELAAERTRGAHPYLVDPAHTRAARAALGPGPLLAPELKVVLDDDPVRARAIAREHLASYLELPTTPATCCAAATPRRTSPTGAATASSTASSRTATWPRSCAGRASTSTPGRTTSASTC